jgi:dTMP kinase
LSLFISFEGIDLSGKSTQVELLESSLRASGREVLATREPGGTALGEAVRNLLLHGEHVHQWAEAALFAAARAQLVHEVIRPALDAGVDVLCDRFIDSSLAYQGVGRGLGVDRILEMNHAAIGDLLPRLSFVMLLSPEDAYSRMPAQLSLMASERGTVGPPDRIEREAIDFKHRVDAGYRLLIERFPERLVALDATQSPEDIAQIVREHVEPLLIRHENPDARRR